MQVRNLLGRWGRNPALIDSLPERERWPDNAGMYIIKAWWRWLQAAEPVYGPESQWDAPSAGKDPSPS
jgi:hypothetical protein